MSPSNYIRSEKGPEAVMQCAGDKLFTGDATNGLGYVYPNLIE
jgi:hypothetical protein